MPGMKFFISKTTGVKLLMYCNRSASWVFLEYLLTFFRTAFVRTSPEVLLKRVVLKNFTKCPGRHSYRSLLGISSNIDNPSKILHIFLECAKFIPPTHNFFLIISWFEIITVEQYITKHKDVMYSLARTISNNINNIKDTCALYIEA